MKNITVCILVILAIVTGALGSYFYLKPIIQSSKTNSKAPLYWVAPMDPNYQRNKPGLSPMGMELVPVYALTAKETTNDNKAVHISNAVSQQINIKTAKVAHIYWQESIKSFATFKYNEEKTIHLHGRVSGWIETLFVKSQGQRVEKGQPLYTFYSPELAHAQEELVLSLKNEEPQLIQGAVSKLASLYVPQSAIDKITKQQKVQGAITYFAPATGYVKTLQVRQGMYVKPEAQILSISSLDDLWLIAEVFESQLPQIKKGTHVTYYSDVYPGQSFEGKVDFIYPSLSQHSNLAKVRIRINNSDEKFRPQMQANVLFNHQDTVKSFVVPSQSVIRTGNTERVVLKTSDNKFIVRPIKVASYHQGHAKVIKGLLGTETLVTSSQFLIDSQANINQAALRMNDNDTKHANKDKLTVLKQPWVSGTITQIQDAKATNDKRNSRHTPTPHDTNDTVLTISHHAIAHWKRPAMTMSFRLDKAIASLYGNQSLNIGDEIRFRFIKEQNKFVIIDIQKNKVQSLMQKMSEHNHD